MNTIKTLHREAELQRRHVRFYLVFKGRSAVRMVKALGAMLNPNQYDRMKRAGVVK